jgi:hypothetical protein
MGQVLVNPQNGLAEDLDPGVVPQKIQQGYLMPLHDQKGARFTLPYDQASHAIASGQYRQPSSDELGQWMNLSHFQSPEQQALAFAEGAGRGVAGPLATAAETHVLGVNPSDILARKSLNPGSAMSGEMGSLALGGLAMKGVFGAIKAAEYIPTIGNLISKAAEAGTAGIATEGFFGPLAKGAAQGAIGSGLYQAQNEISEHMMGDPNSTAEHIISNIGLATVLGGGLGGALQMGMGPFAKIAKTADAASEMAQKALPEEAQMGIDPFTKEPVPISGQMADKPYAGIDPFTKEPLENQMKGWSPAEEAAPAMAQEAIPKPGMISPKDIVKLFTNPTELAASKLSKFAGQYGINQIAKSFPDQAPKVASLLSAFRTGVQTLSNVERESAALFGYGGTQLAQNDEHSKTMSPLYEKVNDIAANPESLIDHMANSTTRFSSHMPDITIGLSQVISKAVGALQQLRPNLSQAAPLDTKKEPTPAQMSKFNDAANILANPISILPKIKNGTITNDHLALVNQVYPNVLKSMQQQAMHNLVQYQSENKGPLNSKMRIGLSKLFGQNMDSSINSLSKNQAILSGIQMQKQQQQQIQTKPSKTGMGKMKISGDQTKAQQSLQRTAS